ncbi:FAD-dependent oxidoreductase [Amphritea sp.]|uniref:flavin monoamine oxidase family protein n=1 Tax=Amphritea sp. TaxID=1872502 RepID=UPI0025C4E476|nr:FAD-dependent oxidoreductase [Amphritea sp.]
MSFVEHLIIGGGISGCVMARQLAKHQLNFKLVEAQATLGGRIQSTEQGLDLGPTWFWPHQHSVESLLAELHIGFFEQYTQGDYVYQTEPNSPITRGRDQQGMLSYRVNGGMGTVITALSNTIPDENILLNSPVNQISKRDNIWRVTLINGGELSCDHLWLAMPPRKIAPLFLAADNRVLSEALVAHLQAQQTWMSAQAKFVAVYAKAFWRDAGLSGQGFSRVGPMVEINDACGADSNAPAALFGFVGIPAVNRQPLDEQQVINACVTQLGKLFGDAALSPISTHYVDWASNSLIASAADISEPSQHAHFNEAKYKAELKKLNLGLIGAEFSQTEPGYIAGAIDHVNKQVSEL